MTSTSSLEGKRALVTGGSGGIGAAIVRRLAYQDMSVSDCTGVLTGSGLPAEMAAAVADHDAGLARGELFTAGDDLVKLMGRPATTAHEAIQNAAASLTGSLRGEGHLGHRHPPRVGPALHCHPRCSRAPTVQSTKGKSMYTLPWCSSPCRFRDNHLAGDTALFITLMLSVIGRTVEARDAKRLHAAIESAPDEWPQADLRKLQLASSPIYSVFFGTSQVVALLSLMTNRPGLAISIAACAIAAVVSAIAATIRIRSVRRATHVPLVTSKPDGQASHSSQPSASPRKGQPAEREARSATVRPLALRSAVSRSPGKTG